MAVATFDTLKVSKALRDAGVSERQADAEAEFTGLPVVGLIGGLIAIAIATLIAARLLKKTARPGTSVDSGPPRGS